MLEWIIMRFDELDTKMRVFETSHDHCVIPGIYIVTRLNGRGFTRLTKKIGKFEVPFDVRFRDFMIETVTHLIACGFDVIYGYTESDEISLLFNLNENTFGRQVRKINTTLAAEASAKFSLLMESIACFDCRVSQLPGTKYVVDYFRWRAEDAHRNALSSHCYWALRKAGLSRRKASRQLEGVSVADKNELLFQHGINFNELPSWQKRGVGVYPEKYEREGTNPINGEKVQATRRRLVTEMELPIGDEYSSFILKRLMGP